MGKRFLWVFECQDFQDGVPKSCTPERIFIAAMQQISVKREMVFAYVPVSVCDTTFYLNYSRREF